MADDGLINAIRSLQLAVDRLTAGSKVDVPSMGSGGTPNIGGFKSSPGGILMPASELDKYKDANASHIDGIKKSTEDHVKGIKKTNDDFFQDLTKRNLQLAPLYEALNLYNKYSLQIPAQMMGGGAGRGMRAGMDMSKDAGQMGFDIASALSASLGPAGIMAAIGIQAAGRGGGAAILGDAIFRGRATEGGLKRMYMEDFEGKKNQWGNEESGMFLARTGRLQAQAGAWGGPNVRGLISGLAGSLNEDPHAMEQMVAQAFKIGGTAGIKNIDQKTIETMVKEGYGSATEVIAAQATAGRYGYGRGAVGDMANRTGLTMDQVLPMMQQTRMQYYMYGKGTAESVNRFVANTSIGAMNPSQGLAAVSQAAQGASAVTDEATSMLQYQSYLQANPGSTYLDFVESKKNGFADDKWRRFVGGAASQYGGTQMGRLIGAGMGMGTPGQIQGLAGTYAEGLGPDVYRTGARKVSADEKYAGIWGGETQAVMESQLDFIGKYVEKFGGEMTKFYGIMQKTVEDATDVVDAVIKARERLNRSTPGLGYMLYGDDDRIVESMAVPGYHP